MAETQNDSPRSLGIAISAGHLRSVVLKSDNTVTSSRSVDLDADQPIRAQIAELARNVINTEDSVSGVGIAVPGLVDLEEKRVAESRVHGLGGLDLKAELSEIRELTVIENDANAAAFAEHRMGAGPGSKDLFYVSLSDGVGSGLIFDGNIWRGSKGFAGEFGSIVVDEEGTRLEEVASGPAIVRRTRSRFHQDSTSVLSKLNEEDIKLDDILNAAAKGDDFARLMLERTGTAVGFAVAVAINLLNVERIVIGGDAVQPESVILDAIIRRARECSAPRLFESTAIVVSQLDEYVAATGAALLARVSEART